MSHREHLDPEMPRTTRKLCKFVQSLKFEDIPKASIERMKLAILDTIGCILLGTKTEAAQIIIDYVRKQDREKESRILGTEIKASAANAALVNGTMGHEFDYDDGISTALGVHAGITIIPAALAIAESQKKNGKELLTSTVAGYELACRVGRAIERTQHASTLTGVFGATAASAKLMGADQNQISNALGMCGSLSNLRPFDPALKGSMVKDMWAGWTNFFGVFCASLAMRGFTAPDDVLDESKGFFKAAVSSGSVDAKALTGELGSRFLWTDGHYFKPYSSCRGTHVTLDAVLDLVRKHRVDHEKIAEILITGRPIVCALKGALMPISARFSTPYVVAAAIVCGRLTLDEFAPDRLKDPRIKRLACKVKTLVDPDIPDYPHAHGPVDVLIRFDDGTTLVSRATVDRSLDEDGVLTKFRENASRVLERNRVDRLVQRMKRLDELQNVQMLTDGLSS